MRRTLLAVALTAAALGTAAAPASATCYIANIDICDKPTDPYTDPIVYAVTCTVRTLQPCL